MLSNTLTYALAMNHDFKKVMNDSHSVYVTLVKLLNMCGDERTFMNEQNVAFINLHRSQLVLEYYLARVYNFLFVAYIRKLVLMIHCKFPRKGDRIVP